ncbi:Tetratricopeptide-like helical domain-containing protein [Dioscorea alata]|uniref:Tetratricopeptide-like helical domain-containing protein n=4 Tax=Dioscorea alata TaxID=55571 RepID=A0ACB7V0P7_DIOAL|nr:Tetratricopeptide-like helical domain-containing protein [Dioscorea alata]KAH7666880.1 Tetratricopeptide-like helical domain-containing protein [Dioscorea alata]KAH7666881.1 Tetratricopeptide-like helical domain-containing protein [Dioscorea alata]KAH7666882.1 Tetratricopeptide-like helical domain-containing protein [Dioscorea alata]
MAPARHLLLLRRCSTTKLLLPFLSLHPHPIPKTLTPSSSSTVRRLFCSDGLSDLHGRIVLLTEKPSSSDADADAIRSQLSDLTSRLLSLPDPADPSPILSSSPLLPSFAFLHLLSLLRSRPSLALAAFDWRRHHSDSFSPPIHPEEYAKAITIAGRNHNPELASELLTDARKRRVISTSVYNALMAAYMYNGLTKKAISVFDDLKLDPDCKPSVVTYNILLSVFGRSMMVTPMEAVLRTIEESELSPNISTYNTVIAGYITAWMWDKMESTYRLMEEGPVKPDNHTHLLMLRGYAHSGNLEKMEQVYELVKEHVNDKDAQLIRAMICAYCKSNDPERVKKIETLSKFIPEEDYRPWLNVLLIRVYAQEGLMEAMERFVFEAFQRNTIVTTIGVMNSIISGYFQCNAVDRLAGFVRRAEYAGWRLCRSLFHCKMVMYGKEKRWEEMHSVLDEMELFRFDPTKKTYLIMYKAYSEIGRRWEAETVIGKMWKHGFVTPAEVVNSLQLT